ncbi:RecX family transcriptional regulator [Enterococcus timonensis]|uniref:RecX family transcriptional regulator n=1 Tax=Enterococcus timonensis TaxID=1852364 RepID=UPI0008DA5C82|nr:RecX family transcriptional regulator [Enterococcus timonensis]
MLTIEKVSQQKMGYQLHLSDQSTLLVSEDQLVEHRLLKGAEISPSLLETIKKEGSKMVGLQLAYHYLNYGLRTESEVRRYLKDKEIPSADIKEIIVRLKQLELVNDQFYAQSFVRTQMKTGTAGPKVVSQKLREKGVKSELVAESLTLFDEKTEEKIATRVAKVYLKRPQKVSKRQKIQKLRVHLMQKGFSAPVISNVIEEIPQEVEDETDLIAELGEKAFSKYAKELPGKRRQKVKETLYRKGFALEAINAFVEQFEMDNE